MADGGVLAVALMENGGQGCQVVETEDSCFFKRCVGGELLRGHGEPIDASETHNAQIVCALSC